MLWLSEKLGNVGSVRNFGSSRRPSEMGPEVEDAQIALIRDNEKDGRLSLLPQFFANRRLRNRLFKQ